jgi:hypothetical protein
VQNVWNAESRESSRPIAYVAVEDGSTRANIIATLERAGWAVIPQPTGFHLLQAIADVIDGNYTWLDPMLIVIDAYARGCAGTTIATGLRDLGITIPILLLTSRGEHVPVTGDEALRIVDDRDATTIAEVLAAARPPPRLVVHERPAELGQLGPAPCAP